MKKAEIHRPTVLSIAGFDPSGGAGINADIKTFEAHQVYGFGVCSGLTVQNDVEFHAVHWTSPKLMVQQIDLLFQRFDIAVAKIGLIENLQILQQITQHLKQLNPNIFIIWDPILKASAGFEFHQRIDVVLLQNLCKKTDLITPNLPEFNQLFPNLTPEKAAQEFQCHLLVKGGHQTGKFSTDVLAQVHAPAQHIQQARSPYDKHGTGCVLSAAIAANLSLGFDLFISCIRAQAYVARFIASDVGLLGFHGDGYVV